MKTWGSGGPRHEMEASGQLHTPAPLRPQWSQARRQSRADSLEERNVSSPSQLSYPNSVVHGAKYDYKTNIWRNFRTQ
jgi:hypothetical protein